MTNCKRGDVVLVRFPDSNMVTYKKRPALVTQSDMIATGINQKIVVMITTNMERIGSTRVSVSKGSSEGQTMGILSDSVIVTDNIATILSREIDKVIGQCTFMDQVDGALRTTLDL